MRPSMPTSKPPAKSDSTDTMKRRSSYSTRCAHGTGGNFPSSRISQATATEAALSTGTLSIYAFSCSCCGLRVLHHLFLLYGGAFCDALTRENYMIIVVVETQKQDTNAELFLPCLCVVPERNTVRRCSTFALSRRSLRGSVTMQAQ